MESIRIDLYLVHCICAYIVYSSVVLIVEQ